MFLTYLDLIEFNLKFIMLQLFIIVRLGGKDNLRNSLKTQGLTFRFPDPQRIANPRFPES